MLKQSMFKVLDIWGHCICVQIRVFWHIACCIKKYQLEIVNYLSPVIHFNIHCAALQVYLGWNLLSTLASLVRT